MLPGLVIMRGNVRSMETMRWRRSAEAGESGTPSEISMMGSGGGAYGICSPIGDGIFIVDNDDCCGKDSPPICAKLPRSYMFIPGGIENPVMPAVALLKAGSRTMGAADVAVVARVVAIVVARVDGVVTARFIVVSMFTQLSTVVNGGTSARSEQQDSWHPE